MKQTGLNSLSPELIQALHGEMVPKFLATQDSSGKPNVVFAHLTRTPEREAKFHWIGKIADDRGR